MAADLQELRRLTVAYPAVTTQKRLLVLESVLCTCNRPFNIFDVGEYLLVAHHHSTCPFSFCHDCLRFNFFRYFLDIHGRDAAWYMRVHQTDDVIRPVVDLMLQL